MKNTIIVGIGTLLVGGFLGYAFGSYQEYNVENMDESMMGHGLSVDEMSDMSMAGANPDDLSIGGHDHSMLNVDQTLPVPSVAVVATPDKKDGFNVQLITENFTFAPAAVNTDPVANEGHAHIFVNDTKVARLYGEWYNLRADDLEEGLNTIEVTLNANDHSEWAVDGSHIQATVKVDKADAGAMKMKM